MYICIYRVSDPLQSPFGKGICRTLRSIGSIKITLKLDFRTKRRERKNCFGNMTWCSGLNNWHHFGYVDYATCYSFSFQWLTDRLTHRHHQISLNICKWFFFYLLNVSSISEAEDKCWNRCCYRCWRLVFEWESRVIHIYQ